MMREELVTALARKTNISKRKTARYIDAFTELIYETLESGEDVVLKTLGKFEIRELAENEHYNPNTGERYVIPAKKRVVFKVADKLKDAIKAN